MVRVNPLCHNYVYKYVLYNSMLNLIQPCDAERLMINGQSNKMSMIFANLYIYIP